MKRIGLALSGGGFRASLYHLGLVRFLRDAGLLRQVTHITSVSGGSILAAHLALNWDRYNGSPTEFAAAASEVLSFVRLDVRNRILRRFPLSYLIRGPRRLLGRSNRRLTRTGLLEYHYEKYLYGDTSLFELPEKPQLHILATNLSEGCLCSFTRNGLLMVRRQANGASRIDHLHVGLATVPMAVTASSAFPGFFPPLELTGTDVGARNGDFGRQTYTDGGVFDNLGVRMFHVLERSLFTESPLTGDDFFNSHQVVDALVQASKSSDESPLRRLAQLMVGACGRTNAPALESGSVLVHNAAPANAAEGQCHGIDSAVSRLSDVLRDHQFHHEPLFADLKPVEHAAEALINASRADGRTLNPGEQRWLNRHLFEAAFRQATGHACFRRLNSGLDGVLVSDVGKRIQVQANHRAGGLVQTAMRATDILMDRVWQLETETFHDAPGFVFAPLTEVVDPSEDPSALHPEIQHQVANIRTDLDRFSFLEISGLIRHGYCVGRKVCRARPDVFGGDLPWEAPWDPFPQAKEVVTSLGAPAQFSGTSKEPAAATIQSRTLQSSAVRRIWSTLLDCRDWSSYVYVPILIPIFVLLPYFLIKFYERSQRLSQLVESLSHGTRDLEQMSRLLEGPIAPWTGVAPEEVGAFDQKPVKGFEVLQDSRITDLRNWNPAGADKTDLQTMMYGYHRLKVVKRAEKTGDSVFRLLLLPLSPAARVQFPPQQLQPKLRMSRGVNPDSGEKEAHWEASFDFQKVPVGEYVDLIVEYFTPAHNLERTENSMTLHFEPLAETAELTRWHLLPKGKEYKQFRIIRYEAGKPETAEPVKVVTEFLADDSTILAYKLLSVKPGYRYEVTWYYK